MLMSDEIELNASSLVCCLQLYMEKLDKALKGDLSFCAVRQLTSRFCRRTIHFHYQPFNLLIKMMMADPQIVERTLLVHRCVALRQMNVHVHASRSQQSWV